MIEISSNIYMLSALKMLISPQSVTQQLPVSLQSRRGILHFNTVLTKQSAARASVDRKYSHELFPVQQEVRC